VNRLRTRVFFGLLFSIAFAAVTSYFATSLLGPAPGEAPIRVTARTIQTNLEQWWGDPARCDAYMRDVRKNTGLDLVLLRDLNQLPRAAMRAKRRDAITFDPDGHAYIPISDKGDLVAIVELRMARSPPRPRPTVAIAVAVVVLAAAAYFLSRRLTRPLEDVAQAARRFGGGDLSARALSKSEESSEEVRSVAAAFDEMAERIQRVVVDQRSLLGAISHELRSPLGRARVALEIARDRTHDPALDRIEKDLGEIDAILTDLLASARAGLSDLRPQQTDLASWLRERIALEPESPPIELVITTPITLHVDQALLGRAFANLVQNARKYGHPSDKPLVVRVDKTAKGAKIAVEDLGPGIPEDVLPRVFDAFVRADKARTPKKGAHDAHEGTGLGLTLVQRIAEAHRGTAGAENRTPEGPGLGAGAGGARVWFTVEDLAPEGAPS
jgi:signal transduction histidine kinase